MAATSSRGASLVVLLLAASCGSGPVIDDPTLPDAGPGVACGTCTSDRDCERVARCVATAEGKACVPRCEADQPICPAGFTCDSLAGNGAAVCVPSGPCCIDVDRDSYGRGIGCAGADCDDANAEANPEAAERCNGLDDDCDGAIDEALGQDTCGVGECVRTIDRCSGGVTQTCTPKAPTAEICNGRDDDCDGTADEGDPGGGASCSTGEPGVCAAGTLRCVSGTVSCVRNATPSDDVCDGVDNDCDPASADGSEDPSNGSACDGPDSDLCLEGTRSCVAGALGCSDNTGSTLDVCDGADNDCDPSSADGSEDPLNGSACDGPDSDLCLEGTRSCATGALACSDNTGSILDVCDGVDNDCDPASADGSEDPLNGAACDGPDSDLCLEGTSACAMGGLVCSDNTGSSVDVCDGLDNDCDPSSPDGAEDPLSGSACDGADSDLCLEGTRSCSGGALVCSDNTGSSVDVCDGLDNDCDAASADGSEDPLNGSACDGADSDLCLEGARSCAMGGLVCSDTTGSSVDVCDGLDNDCDPASLDGSEDPLSGSACDGSDSDVCLEGTRSCSGGTLVCSDSTGDTPEVCGDGLDNDCDGATDEGCCANQVLDPGFEAGPPWPAWTQSSTTFTTPLCSTAGCCSTAPAWCGPHTGVFWTWLGGVASAVETSSVSQAVVIPAGATTLRFFFMLPVCASAGSDQARLSIDGTPVWTVTRTDPACDVHTWVQKSVSIAAYADGGSHTIEFRAVTDGMGVSGDQITDFMIDDVELAFCP